MVEWHPVALVACRQLSSGTPTLFLPSVRLSQNDDLDVGRQDRTHGSSSCTCSKSNPSYWLQKQSNSKERLHQHTRQAVDNGHSSFSSECPCSSDQRARSCQTNITVAEPATARVILEAAVQPYASMQFSRALHLYASGALGLTSKYADSSEKAPQCNPLKLSWILVPQYLPSTTGTLPHESGAERHLSPKFQ